MNWLKAQTIATVGAIALTLGITHTTIALTPNAAIAQNLLAVSKLDAPSIQALFETANKLVDEYRKNGDKTKLDKAIAIYRSIVKDDPNHLEAYRNLGEALTLNNQLNLAIAAYRQVVNLEIQPADDSPLQAARAYNYLGNALTDAHRLDEALIFRRKALALTPDLPWSYLQLADTLAAHNQLPESLVTYRKAIDLEIQQADGMSNSIKDLEASYTDPQAVAYKEMGIALLRYRKVEQGIAALRQALALEPQYRDAYAELGRALSLQHNLDGAFTAYRKSLELDSYQLGSNLDAAAFLELGNALSEQHQFDEAIATYRKAIVRDTKNAIAYYHLGRLLIHEKQMSQAIPVLRQAIVLDAKNEDAYVDLGFSLTELQRWNEAITVYRQWAANNPRNVLPYNYLGTLLTRQNQLKEALSAFRTYIELAKRNISMRPDISGNPATVTSEVVLLDASRVSNEATAYFYLGNALADRNQLDTAIANYQQALKLDANYSHAYDGLGVVLMKEDRLVEAIAAFKQALGINPSSVETQQNLRQAEERVSQRGLVLYRNKARLV